MKINQFILLSLVFSLSFSWAEIVTLCFGVKLKLRWQWTTVTFNNFRRNLAHKKICIFLKKICIFLKSPRKSSRWIITY